MAKLVVTCPSCSGELVAVRMSCQSCGTSLEGHFALPAILHLSPEDLAFVTAFVRTSGSLKAMAQQLGVSYPTVRNRVDEVIARLDALERGVEKRRHAILDALERGVLTAESAAEELRKAGL